MKPFIPYIICVGCAARKRIYSQKELFPTLALVFLLLVPTAAPAGNFYLPPFFVISSSSNVVRTRGIRITCVILIFVHSLLFSTVFPTAWSLLPVIIPPFDSPRRRCRTTTTNCKAKETIRPLTCLCMKPTIQVRYLVLVHFFHCFPFLEDPVDGAKGV